MQFCAIHIRAYYISRTSGTTINTNTLVKSIFDSNPVGTMLNELSAPGAFKGMAILNSAGKILGITGAATSLVTLGVDIFDGGGVSMVNVADAAISVGSLAVKSNVVGLGVSMGWLLIKGELERNN